MVRLPLGSGGAPAGRWSIEFLVFTGPLCLLSRWRRRGASSLSFLITPLLFYHEPVDRDNGKRLFRSVTKPATNDLMLPFQLAKSGTLSRRLGRRVPSQASPGKTHESTPGCKHPALTRKLLNFQIRKETLTPLSYSRRNCVDV